MEELNCKTVFELSGSRRNFRICGCYMDHYGSSGRIASLILVRNLKVENPGKSSAWHWKLQLTGRTDFFEGILGKGNKRYIPYLITVLLYLACANMIGLLGFKPPTKDLNVTAALADDEYVPDRIFRHT